MSVASDDAITYSNTSLGEAVQFVVHSVSETVTSYSPPLLVKFDPDRTKPGDSWSETNSVNTTVRVNGTTVLSTSQAVTYDVEVASSKETITTQAGTFDTLKITVTRTGGSRTVSWWSSGAQNFVLKKEYTPLSTTPISTMALKSFEVSAGAAILIIAAAGMAVIIVAVMILFSILSARRPKQPVHQEQPGPGQSPPEG